ARKSLRTILLASWLAQLVNMSCTAHGAFFITATYSRQSHQIFTLEIIHSVSSLQYLKIDWVKVGWRFFQFFSSSARST
ncbi:unnamed protein product, partial [Ectocarpus sp. 13 AM-2016]